MKNDIENNFINQEQINKIFLILIIIIIFYLKLNFRYIKVSVIIPTFNRGNIIVDSIKSVLNQTLKNLEVIIIDDGSTDNTQRQIEKLRDRRIRYIKLNNNRGGGNARNIGILLAKGEYISFQDSDDYFYPDKLEKQLKNLVNKNGDLDFCKIRVIFNKTYSYFVPNEKSEQRIEKGSFENELLTFGNFISTQAILAKTSFIRQYYFDPNMPRLQDYDMILRMIPNVKFSYTREVLVDLNIQNNSLTKSAYKLKKAVYLLLSKNYNFNKNQKKVFYNYLNHLLELLSNVKLEDEN